MSRVTQKGQVTIPAEIRRKFNLHANTEVEVLEKDGQVVVQAKYGGMNRGRWIAEQLCGKATRRDMTADELIHLLRGDD